MCGITGAYYFKNPPPDVADRAACANAALVLRGPDGGAVESCTAGVALGHRRLSVIDVSDAASQPMSDASGRFTIVFNGEIYNYRELRSTHLSGEETSLLKSHSDTEILLHLFMKMGASCFALLDGFFALAIYDRQCGVLTLARDRFGKKPLHFHLTDDRLVFSSEMKSLLTYDIPRKVDMATLRLYLQLGYVPQPMSMIQDVSKLMPGQWLEVGPTGAVQTHTYFQLETAPDQYGRHSYAEAQTILLSLMEQAVAKRMVADVPLGAFLSGGIDSSAIVALAAGLKKQLRTFSIGYADEPFFDETRYARLVADKYKTDHTVFSLRNDDFLEHIHAILDYIDEPFADPSAIPTYILCHETRKHVTVALSGDGGDEVFAGYNKHMAEWQARNAGLVHKIIKAAYPVWKALPQGRHGKWPNRIRQLHRFSEGLRLSNKDRYWRWASLISEQEVTQMLQPAANGGFSAEIYQQLKSGITARLETKDLNEVLIADFNLVLLGDMLVKADLMSMANSLEVRSPFLDRDVVNFAFSIPDDFKIKKGIKKRIVQDSFRKLLPEELYNRPKQGFDVPLLKWFRHELDSFIFQDLLHPDFIAEQGLFNPEAISGLRAKLHSCSPGDTVEHLWTLIVFQHWYKQYIHE